jgi:hypothetical protein
MALLLVACQDRAQENSHRATLVEAAKAINQRRMDRDQFASPENDALSALERRDYSLLGVYRFSIYVPGVGSDYGTLITKFKIRMIQGTSDIIIENDGNSFNKRAEAYASSYNRAILAKLGCDINNPMLPCSNYTAPSRKRR